MKSKHSFLQRIFFILIFTSMFVYSNEVFVATKNIKFKEKISKNNIALKKIVSKIKCEPLSVSEFEKNDFNASHFIFKDSVICTEDVDKYEKESVVFDFGAFEIEQEGKILFENEEYLRIKKQDGNVHKIYKNGKIE